LNEVTAAMPESIARLAADDPRTTRGLFTLAEAAGWLDVPRTTFRSWALGYEKRRADGPAAGARPIVLTVPSRRGEPGIPFLGMAEGLVLNAFRRAGVPLQRIRPALERLDQEMGLEHALASDRLFTDGVEVLFDYGARLRPASIRELVTVRSGQRVFAPVVREYLRRITYADDHWASQVELPGYQHARVVVSLDVARGRPVLQPARVRVEDVVDRWIAGDSITELARGFGLETREVEDVVRAATRRCAA
jgi:uncharacterized protein (DUF433 family)